MATCELPYPPPLMKINKYQDYCETIEEENEITKQYIKEYGHSSMSSIKYFANTYDGENPRVSILKKWINNDRANIIYDGFIGVLDNVCDEEKSKTIGQKIYELTKDTGDDFEAMGTVYYLVSWYMKSSNNQIIGSYPRVLEHYWDEIGSWLA